MKAFAKRNRNKGSPPQVSWEQILNNVEDGVITVDQGGTIVFFNEAAEVLTEVSSAKALHGRFERLFMREPWLLDLAKKARPPRQESAHGEGELLTRWGGKAPVSVTASPLRDSAGRFQGVILLMRDIKHRKELEEDLKRADRLAMTGTIAAGLAHEIRNPLGGIKGAAQLVRRSLEPESPLRPYTDIMIREVERVNQLIEQLLDLSRPSALRPAPLNVHELLDEVLLLQNQDMAGKELSVRKRYDPSLPPIRGDRGRLTQVFLNLIKNAFQSMDDHGAVTITTRLETDYYIREPGAARNRFIWVEITDQGSGIRQEDLAHIFSPFFTTKPSGTGLGLAICYRIIQEHGGLIRVESAEHKGSTFKVSLVVAD